MTWTPVTEQSEAWTADNPQSRVFSPLVFALHPVFDTGSVAGIWAARSEQPEAWTET